eukprot:7046086-Karenia_brevis.AAC.1
MFLSSCAAGGRGSLGACRAAAAASTHAYDRKALRSISRNQRLMSPKNGGKHRIKRKPSRKPFKPPT